MFNNKYLSLLIIVLITFSASAIGGVVTSIYKEPWYSQIIRPSFSPPASVFGLILEIRKQSKSISFIFFLIQFGALFFLVFIKSF